MNEKENYRYLSLKAEKDREYLVRKANKYKQELEGLRARFKEFKQNSKNFERESMILNKAYQASSIFVESLEEEVDTLRGQFKLLEGMIPPEKLKSFQKESPFSFIQKKNNMTKHIVNNKSVEIMNMMYRDCFQSHGTSTEIYGLDKEIIVKDEKIVDMKTPMFDIGVQTTILKQVNTSAQTQLTLEGVQNLEDKIENLEKEKENLGEENENFQEDLLKMKHEFNIKGVVQRKDSIESKYLNDDDKESVTSELENQDKVFITEDNFEERTIKSRSTKSRNSIKRKNTMRSRNTKSKFGSIESTLSKSKNKVKYIYCQDCKRRRIKKKNASKSPSEKRRKFSYAQEMNKVEPTKILRSQSRLNNPIGQQIEKGDESDFNIDDEFDSNMSIDSNYSWKYGNL